MGGGVTAAFLLMAQCEIWYFVKDGNLYQHFENDGYAALRHGIGVSNTLLCSVEEAKTKYPKELAESYHYEKEAD